jgi:hypothetical protein
MSGLFRLAPPLSGKYFVNEQKASDSGFLQISQTGEFSSMEDAGKTLVVGLVPCLQIRLRYDPPVILGFQILIITGLDEQSGEGVPCFETDPNRIFVQVTGLNELLDLVVCHAVLLIFLQSTTFDPKSAHQEALFLPSFIVLSFYSHV